MAHAQQVLRSRRSVYAAPELLAADEPADIDAKCDVYSLGVVAVETLTGALPGRSSGDVAGATIAVGLSPEFADFLNRMLNQDPAQRPSSADALEAFQREASSLTAVAANIE